MAALLDRCVFLPVSSGTADFVVSAAVPGFMTPAQAGGVNGTTYSYVASSSDDQLWEIGRGVYTSGTLTRATVLFSSASGVKVNFNVAPTVAIDAIAEDLAVSSDITLYEAVDSYSGGAANSLWFSTRGSISAPVTDNGATAIFQSVGAQTSDSGTTVYVSWDKRTTTNNVGGRPIWAEAVDHVGGPGSYVEGARFSSAMLGGTGGNSNGLTSLSIATVPYEYLDGLEAQCFNLVADATTTFNNLAWESGVLLSNLGTKKSFAAIQTNYFSTAPFINGFYIAQNSVQDSGFRNDAALVNGVDLSRGTYSGAAFKSPGFSVDGNGNVSGLFIEAGAASGIFWAGRSSMSSPSDGVILLSNNAVTSFAQLRLGGAAASLAVGANQVVGARLTGWTVATGTPQRSTFDTSSVTLVQLAGVVMALEQDLIMHGLIGT